MIEPTKLIKSLKKIKNDSETDSISETEKARVAGEIEALDILILVLEKVEKIEDDLITIGGFSLMYEIERARRKYKINLQEY